MRTMLLFSIAVLLAAGSESAAQGTRPFPKGTGADVDQRLKRIEGQLGELVKQLEGLRASAKGRQPGGPVAEAPGAEAPRAVHIYVLKHAKAQDLAVVLRELFAPQRLSLAVDVRTNSLIATGDLHETIETILGRLDVPIEGKLRQQDAGKKTQLDDLRRRREIAQADLEQRRDRLTWSERMWKKGFAAESQLQADRAHLLAAEATLRQIEAQLPKPASDK